MDEKQMNQELLSKIYDVCEESMKGIDAEKSNIGTYTAAKVYSKICKSEVHFRDGFDEWERREISVGGFSCKIPLREAFDIASKYEKLPGIPTALKRTFSVKKSVGEEVARITFTMNKDLARMASFAGKDELRPLMSHVLVTRDGYVVASDGHKLSVMRVDVTDYDDLKLDGPEDFLIPADAFKKMASAAGKNGAPCTVSTIKKYEGECESFEQVSDCAGVTAITDRMRYPKWQGVLGRYYDKHAIKFSKNEWKNVVAWAKKTKPCHEDVPVIYVENIGGNIVFTEQRYANKGTNSYTAKVDLMPDFHFRFAMSAEHMGLFKNPTLYVGKDHVSPIVLTDDNSVNLSMPFNMNGEETLTWEASCASKPTMELVDALGMSCTTKVETPAVQVAPEPEPTPEPQVETPATEETVTKPQAAEPVEPIEEQPTEQVKKQEQPKATKPKAQRTAPKKNAFSLAACGIKAFEILRFVDGKYVITLENGNVFYEDEQYSLSGFTKKFVPEKMRKPCGCYQGPKYFTYKGENLLKLAKRMKQVS